jgi:hypothetical protein
LVFLGSLLQFSYGLPGEGEECFQLARLPAKGSPLTADNVELFSYGATDSPGGDEPSGGADAWLQTDVAQAGDKAWRH